MNYRNGGSKTSKESDRESKISNNKDKFGMLGEENMITDQISSHIPFNLLKVVMITGVSSNYEIIMIPIIKIIKNILKIPI